jgi:pimeloyl-ACP methyl ester carboxylesterase
MRGSGLSDPVDLSKPPTIDDWADDGLAVLDAVGSRAATVLSSWNIIGPAITLALAHPERVERLILIKWMRTLGARSGLSG